MVLQNSEDVPLSRVTLPVQYRYISVLRCTGTSSGTLGLAYHPEYLALRDYSGDVPHANVPVHK